MRKRKILFTCSLLVMSYVTIQLYLYVHRPPFQLFRSSRRWFHGSSSDEAETSESGQRPTSPVSGTFASKSAENGRQYSKNNNNDDDNNNNNQQQQQQQQNSAFDFPSIAAKVDDLERQLAMQIKSNEELLRTMRTIGQLAKQMGKSVVDRDVKEEFLKQLRNSNAKKMQDPVIAVLLFACNRVTVKRNIDQLIRFRRNVSMFPIVVSQDCAHEPTRRIIESYGDALHFVEQPNQSDIVLRGKTQKKFKGYYKISRHYGWALNYTFNVLKHETVLIVEDDLDISPDFFEYFTALYPLLRNDPSVYCISAWNDNGKDGLVEHDPTKLYRSDFFPGLGWMFTKDLWLEYQNKWPKAFWDDWIREPDQRKNRVCIRPELSRTKTFGKKGVSNGLFYEKHLKFIKLNDQYVPFTRMNLSYLLKENYDVEFLKQVYTSRLLAPLELRALPSVTPREHTIDELVAANRNGSNPLAITPGAPRSIRIQYTTMQQFKKTAKMFGLMDDFKCGVPRTGYQGVVSFMHRGYRVYLSPSPMWSGYNITWK